MATTLRADQMYSNWPDPNGIFEGWAMYDIPIESNSQIYGTIHNERRVSTTDTVVVPRYNPFSVEGVWLAEDEEHTGTNYFTGGSVRYDQRARRYAELFGEGTAGPRIGCSSSGDFKPTRQAGIAGVEDVQSKHVKRPRWPMIVSHGLWLAYLVNGSTCGT